MQKIKQAVFETSFAKYDPRKIKPLPEIALVGRSNVGKSSLINMLTGNSKLARISAEPGKTRLINYFLIDNRYHLVDLPGYGFAKAPKSEQQKWGFMIEDYLKYSENLMVVLLLVDIRHRPSADDKMMIDWLRSYGVPFRVIATKADKVSRAQQQKLLMDITFDLKLDMVRDIIVTSSEKKQGLDTMLTFINQVVEEAYAPEEDLLLPQEPEEEEN